MSQTILRASTIGALTLALLATTSSAYALEGKALFEKLMTQAPGTAVAYEAVEETSSDSFVMKGVSLTKNGTTQLMKIGSVVVEGLREADGGRITYNSIALTNLLGTGDRPGKGEIDAITATNGDIPFEALKNKIPAELKSQRILLGNVSINGMKMTELPKGGAFGWESVSLVNADIPLDFRYKGPPSAEPPAAPLTFDSFSVKQFTGQSEGVGWSMAGIDLQKANFPTIPNAPIDQMMKIYSTLFIEGISVNLGPTEAFKMDSMESTLTPLAGDGSATSTATMKGMTVNLKAIPDRRTQAIAQQLGYDKVEGDMTATGSYNSSTGRADVSELTLDLKDMLKLGMEYAITGYTAEVVKKVQDAQLAAAAGTPPAQAYGAILPSLSGVKIENLSLNLTDQSLTGKLLDFQAKQMGTTGEQLAQGAPLMLGLGLARFNMPAFADMLTAAVGKFLKDKGTLSLTAKPENPVSITELLQAQQSDPTKIPELLNVKITAQ